MITGLIFSNHLLEKKWQAIIIFSVFVLQYFFEHFFPENKKNNNAKNELKNIAVGVANALIIFFPSALLVALLTFIEDNHIGILQQFALPLWLNIFITIITMDFFMYWWHRFNHTKKIFWYFHRFHHKDEKMNTTTALRFHIIELLFSTVFKAAFYLVIGFNFLPVLIYEILFFVIVLIHHSNINISTSFDMLYRKVFSSPLMHRIHHSNIQEETDTNYGSVFSWWDRLFHSYKKQVDREIVFGIDERDTA